MMLSTYFEEFMEPQSTLPQAQSAEAKEVNRLEAFEEGYKAGWDDAFAARNETNGAFNSQFQQTISDLSFNYHAAINHASKQACEILQQIIDCVVPEYLTASLEDKVHSILKDKIRDGIRLTASIHIHPNQYEALKKLEDDAHEAEIQIVANNEVEENSAELVIEGEETLVDLTDVQMKLNSLISEYWNETTKTLREAG